jgi:sugar/nucleoside kinase (ribokinase family)
MLQIPDATGYIGCIGKDTIGEEMKKNAQAADINVLVCQSLHYR